MRTIVAGAAIVFLGLVVTEVYKGMGRLAPAIIHLGCRRLPEHVHAEREREWLAELEAVEGLELLRFAFALKTVVSASVIRWQRRGERPVQRVQGSQAVSVETVRGTGTVNGADTVTGSAASALPGFAATGHPDLGGAVGKGEGRTIWMGEARSASGAHFDLVVQDAVHVTDSVVVELKTYEEPGGC